MAQTTITVNVQPTPGLENMIRRLIRDALIEQRPAPQPRARTARPVEPIKIQAPDGERSLFVDDVGESHWVLSRYAESATSRGWRQAYTLAP
jgi:hypothetical protein